MKHLAGASAMAIPAMSMANTLNLHAADLQKRRKSAILLWMGGGPSTIDLWDLKPGAATGGPFKPISTTGDVQISEHLPMMAKQMHNMAIIRSMSTREADHNRGRYYMHTGYVPNPFVEHPSYGAVLAHELIDQRPELEIPPNWKISKSVRKKLRFSGKNRLNRPMSSCLESTSVAAKSVLNVTSQLIAGVSL